MREPATLSASSLPVRGLDVCWARAPVASNMTMTKFIDWWKRELLGRRNGAASIEEPKRNKGHDGT